jgi:hypothetical protein
VGARGLTSAKDRTATIDGGPHHRFFIADNDIWMVSPKTAEILSHDEWVKSENGECRGLTTATWHLNKSAPATRVQRDATQQSCDRQWF